MIFPIQTVMFAGRSEKNRTSEKKISEKIKSPIPSDTPCGSMGAMPVVKEVVAHLGMAKNGPMVRYSRHVNR